MAKFLSGPPGGRTLPLIPPRLSDLEGGVFGPGASVASTGLNAARPVIKTANARAAGETWDDLLEYYSVRPPRSHAARGRCIDACDSLTQTVAKSTLHTVSVKSSTRAASMAPSEALRPAATVRVV